MTYLYVFLSDADLCGSLAAHGSKIICEKVNPLFLHSKKIRSLGNSNQPGNAFRKLFLVSKRVSGPVKRLQRNPISFLDFGNR
jgi:hypothetical protein